MPAQWTAPQHQCAILLSTMIIQAKHLTKFFKHIDTAIANINDDANRDTSAKVTRVIDSAVACYKEL